MTVPAQFSVLLVEDSRVYQRLVVGHLSDWGFNVSMVNDGAKAWEMLQQKDCPKLVLLDWLLPGMDGLELCRKLRARPTSEPYVYTILLTSKEGRTHLLEAMEAGVDDYLVKPFDELELKARLLAGTRILRLHDELIAARESMRHAATHDGLTELMNRTAVLELLDRELARAKRKKSPVGVALADIDHFKAINDEMGHGFGDEVLREVARRLRAKLRIYDGVGRYGGEEFLLVLPGCDLDALTDRSNEIRGLISRVPVVAAGKQRVVTLSMGVAVVDWSKEVAIQALVDRADAGLYQAKGNGRDRVEHVVS